MRTLAIAVMLVACEKPAPTEPVTPPSYFAEVTSMRGERRSPIWELDGLPLTETFTRPARATPPR